LYFNPSRPVGGEENSNIERQILDTYIESFEITYWINEPQFGQVSRLAPALLSIS
jgi:hypothetical protein